MARIAGVDIPRNKRVVISLTYIFGIGRRTASDILENCKISEDVKTKDLTDDQVNLIRNEVSKLMVEGYLWSHKLRHELHHHNSAKQQRRRCVFRWNQQPLGGCSRWLILSVQSNK